MRFYSLLSGYFCAAMICAVGQVNAADSLDFLNMNMRDLADMEVTSVSRKKEKASEAAAAIYVVTQEDIRRSGARHLPEVLRLVPGLNVARAGSSQWAISARGFNDQFANKLLVLMDGRTLYTPNFSGVWWDSQTPMLDDIERIEVIRGPGATVWGANAVNGVINIITKSAADTQGSLAIAGFGNQEKINTQLRHGFAFGDSTNMRIYGSYQDNDEVKRVGGNQGNRDEWDHKRVGFRADWDTLQSGAFTLQGDMFQGKVDQQYMIPITVAPYTSTINDDHEVQGANILMRWDYDISERSELSVKSYLDYNSRDIAIVDMHDLTFDLDIQHKYEFENGHVFNWGAGYRLIEDDFAGSFTLSMNPQERTRNYYNAFAQYKMPLVEDELFLTMGSKFEHNYFTHADVQPSARLSWLINEHQTLWGSVSRAIRTPDRSNNDTFNPISAFPGVGGTNVIVRNGSNTADSEELLAYEIGYRIQPCECLTLDFSTFYNDYDDLFINVMGTPTAVTSGLGAPYIMVPVSLQNVGSGHSYGGEVVANWQVVDGWDLEANYSYLRVHIDNGLSSSVNTSYKSPEHQFGLHSYVNLPHDLEFDQHVYYNDHVDTASGSRIDDYMRLDLRLGWQPVDQVELSLSAENLLDKHHQEFGPFLYNSSTEIGRTIYGQVKVRF